MLKALILRVLCQSHSDKESIIQILNISFYLFIQEFKYHLEFKYLIIFYSRIYHSEFKYFIIFHSKVYHSEFRYFIRSFHLRVYNSNLIFLLRCLFHISLFFVSSFNLIYRINKKRKQTTN